ncbi:hypothetical protein BJV78DRAFT_275392 [Lactifluus subvellereus]|nr:hypothetical protein BJV78DRAFT_275392 [Lactifluus subvellereus]
MVGSSEGFPVGHTVLFPCNGAYGQSTGGKNYRQTTIEILPEVALLEIFDFYRLYAMQVVRGKPWKWQCLAHVCRKWRYVLSISPRRLDLKIIFRSRAPMGSILDSWPGLPIVIRYDEGRNPRLKAVNNIIVALRHQDRVREIDLDVTNSALGSMVEVIQDPFPALERITIKSNETTGSPPVLPGTFLGGSAPRLHTIQLDGISFPFPALRQLLLSANGLVELELTNIPSMAYFSPEDFAIGLSTLPQLRRLTLRFNSPTPRPPPNSTPPPGQARITLPSLTLLSFWGASEYLEGLVSRINVPVLSTFFVVPFNQLNFEIPHLCEFIGRVDALRSPTEVIVNPDQHDVEITLTQPGEPRRVPGKLFLRISCKQLDWQLSFTAQIFSQLSPLLSHVGSLTIGQSGSLQIREEDDGDSTQWLELFQPFGGVTAIYVAEEYVQDIAQALGTVTGDMSMGVLPVLSTLTLQGYRKSASVQEAAELFVATCQRSGHYIDLYGW